MADEISGDSWGERLILRIAGRVRDVRIAQRMSTRELADRMRELGHSISRQTLTNLEGGRKANLSIDDLFAMAHALEVNPMFLIFDPRQMGRQMEILPEVVMPEWMAMRWVTMKSSALDALYEQDFDDARHLTRELANLQRVRSMIAEHEERVRMMRETGRPPLGERMPPEAVQEGIKAADRFIEGLREEERRILRGLEREGVNTNDSWWDPNWITEYGKRWNGDG